MHDIVNAAVSIAASFHFDRRGQEWIASQARSYQSLVAAFGDAVRRGDRSNVRRLAEKAIRSSAAKVVSEIRNYGGTKKTRPPLQVLIDHANSLRPRSALAEPAQLKVQRKLGGGWRPVVAFGPKHKVFHTICEDLLKAALPVNQREYNRRGRGDDRMTIEILTAMHNNGLDHVVSIDVRNCFGSVRKEEVRHLLPLPRWMTETLVLVNHAKRITPSREHEDAPLLPDEAARAGLPQGASTSGLIVSRAIFGPLLAETSFADFTYLYGDNLFVLARGRAEADARLGTLRSLLANSPAGPLTIGSETIYGASEKPHFLKYAGKPIPKEEGGGYRIVPSANSYQRFTDRALEKMGDADAVRGQQILDRYRENWLAAFPLWGLREQSRRYMEMHAGNAYLLKYSS